MEQIEANIPPTPPFGTPSPPSIDRNIPAVELKKVNGSKRSNRLLRLSTSPATKKTESETIIDCVLDVDTGVDDAHALLLALRHPRLNVLAVTTVAGNMDVQTTTKATLKVLDAANAPKDLPVAMGCASPIIEPSHHCPEIHGSDALGDLSPPLPDSTRKIVDDHAVFFMVNLSMYGIDLINLKLSLIFPAQYKTKLHPAYNDFFAFVTKS